MEKVKSSASYKVDPDFMPPEPTGADMFSFSELDDFDFASEVRRVGDWMREAGATQMRVTIVSDDFPNPPYPHGVWWEGWKDPKARQLPFGAARPDDNTLSPPLTCQELKAANALPTPPEAE